MTFFDCVIVAVYLAGIITVGIRSRGRQDNINDYFTARGGFGGRLGSIVVGLSIGATFFSGLSFIVYPSLFFSYGITALCGLAAFPVTYLFMRFWFLPRFLASAGDTPYMIIELRFGKPVRLLASAMFVLLRLCWMSALIYAPVIAVMAVFRIGSEWLWLLVALIGLSSTIYTVVGGIRGVMITDAIQFILIAAALLGTIVFIAWKIPMSINEVSDYLRSRTNLLAFNWSLDPRVTITVATMALGGGILNLGSFAADQMSLQRYIAADNPKSASHAFGTSMIATPVVLIMLAMVGVAVGAWYHLRPDATMPVQADRVFPYFVATQMPAGFTGIVIAAILAATMSSVTSGINALSGSLLTDFVPFSQRVEPRRLLRYARWLSGAVGVAATLGAGLVQRIGSLFEIMTVLLGVFNGPLLACVLCSVANFAIRGPTLFVAMILGFAAGVVVVNSPVSPLWVTAISGSVTALLGVGGSRLFPALRPPIIQIRST